MGSFDDWFEQYKLRAGWINLSEEEDIENAYNAGLARAAEIVSEHSGGHWNWSPVADAIRKELTANSSSISS